MNYKQYPVIIAFAVFILSSIISCSLFGDDALENKTDDKALSLFSTRPDDKIRIAYADSSKIIAEIDSGKTWEHFLLDSQGKIIYEVDANTYSDAFAEASKHWYKDSPVLHTGKLWKSPNSFFFEGNSYYTAHMVSDEDGNSDPKMLATVMQFEISDNKVTYKRYWDFDSKLLQQQKSIIVSPYRLGIFSDDIFLELSDVVFDKKGDMIVNYEFCFLNKHDSTINRGKSRFPSYLSPHGLYFIGDTHLHRYDFESHSFENITAYDADLMWSVMPEGTDFLITKLAVDPKDNHTIVLQSKTQDSKFYLNLAYIGSDKSFVQTIELNDLSGPLDGLSLDLPLWPYDFSFSKEKLEFKVYKDPFRLSWNKEKEFSLKKIEGDIHRTNIMYPYQWWPLGFRGKPTF